MKNINIINSGKTLSEYEMDLIFGGANTNCGNTVAGCCAGTGDNNTNCNNSAAGCCADQKEIIML